MHIHGSNKWDVMDGTRQALEEISKFILKNGTTSFLPTLLTESQEKIFKALKCIRDVKNSDNIDGASILGVHMEGPFFCNKYKGAQNPNYLENGNIEKIKKYLEVDNELIKLFTLAPDIVSEDTIKYLIEKNIIVALGHTGATSKKIKRSVALGLSHSVHTFNGMKGIHHRELGVAGTVLLLDEIMAEIILDGIHIHPDVAKLILKCKGIEKTILVTDAIRATGLPDGEYELGGQKVFLKGGAARIVSGSLAGSVLTMDKAFKNSIELLDLSIIDAVKITSSNAAKELKLDYKGFIEKGYDADLVILGKEDYRVKKVFVDGNEKYSI